MRALCYFYQLCGLFIYCFSVPNSQYQWSTSFVPKTVTSSIFNIPWLVSIDETCQGIILNKWWILSTIRCLTKLKYLASDISKVISKEGILHGNKICLHPNFNPTDGKYPGKTDIGVILLEFPIRRKEISLLQPYNIFRESCFHCVYRHCNVYQYQKHSKYENNMKKLSVKFLDISSCHKQHNHMPKTNNLCIWIHHKEDCWIQQGSPILCTFRNQWELVGLISETTMECNTPILVIKTAPYLSWMRLFMKMNEKPLDNIFSTLCSVYSGGEYDLHNHRRHADFSSLGFSLQSWNELITCSQVRQRRTPPPLFFVSHNKDLFPDSRQLYFQGAHLSSGSKPPLAQLWTTPLFKALGTSKSTLSCNNQLSSDFECIIHSEAKIPPKAYISSRFLQRDRLIYQNGISTTILRQWDDMLDAKTLFHAISINAGRSLIPFSKQVDEFQGTNEIYSFHSKVNPSSFLHQFLLGSWMEVTTNIRSWTQAYTMLPFETETEMWTPFHKEATPTQIYYIVENIKPGTYIETYSLNSWTSLLVSKKEMLTYSTHNYGPHYSSITPKLDPAFNQAWYLLRSHITSKTINEYVISSVPMTNLHSSILTKPYYWPLSTSIAFMSWSDYKPGNIIHLNQLDTTSLLSTHTVSIVKSSKQTENLAWTSFHSNIIKSIIYSKIGIIQPWVQSDSDILKLWTPSEIESVKYSHILKTDKISLWLNTNPEEIKPQIYNKFQDQRSTSKTGEIKIKYWMKSKVGTVTKPHVPWNQPEADSVGGWYWSKSDHSLLKTQSDFNTLPLFTYFEAGLSNPLPESIENIGHWGKIETFLGMPWIYSEGQKIIHQTKPKDNNEVWFQEQTRIIWKQSESPINNYLTKMKEKMTEPMYQSLVDTFKPVTQTELQIMPSWTKHENDKARPWAQIQENSDKQSFHNEMKTVLEWTQPITQSPHKWILSENEAGRLWKLPMTDELKNWVYHNIHTAKSLNVLNVGIVKPRVHHEASTLTQWREAESTKVNQHNPSDTDIVRVWTQGETPVVNDWLDLLEDTSRACIKSQFQELKDRIYYNNDIVTRWTQTETLTVSEMHSFSPWIPGESLNLIPLVDPVFYSMPPWTQNEPTQLSKIIANTLTYWAQTKASATSLAEKLLRNQSKLGAKSEYIVRNHSTISEAYSNLLWTKAHYLKVNNSVEFMSEISKILATDEYPTINPWKQIDIDIMTQLPITESPLEISWSHQASYTIFSHANSPSLINMVNPDCDVITWFQANTLSVNLWTLPCKESLTPWTQYKASENNLWSENKPYQDNLRIYTAFYRGNSWTQAYVISQITPSKIETLYMWTQNIDDLKKIWAFQEMITHTFTSMIQTESPTINQWIYHASDQITIWTQPIYPTRSQWAVTAHSATMWLKSNHPLINLRMPQISDIPILAWPQTVSPTVNLWPQSVTYTGISKLLQDEYTPISLWTNPASDIFTASWPMPELSNEKTQPFFDTEILPGSEPELASEYMWIMPVSDRLTPQLSQNVSPNVNISYQLRSYTYLIPTPQWLLEQTLETNLRPLLASEKKITALVQSEYPTANMLILPMSSKVTLPWPQSKSLSVSQWVWSISHSMMQSWTQDITNQWSMFLTDEITPSWSLDYSPVTKVWGQFTSDTFIFSRIQAPLPKDNLFGLFMSDIIMLPLPQSIYSPVHRERLSGTNTFVPMLTESKFLPAHIRTSYISDKILPNWAQEEFLEGNQWPWSFQDIVTPTWTQVESSKLSLWALIYSNRETANSYSSRYILTNHSSNIITQSWMHTRSLIFSLQTNEVSITISPSHQTESTAENLWSLPLPDIATPMWTNSGILPVYTWTRLLSDTLDSTGPLPESLPIFNRAKQTLLQTESKKINTQTLFVSDSYILPWVLSKHQTLIPWTENIANVLPQWTKSEVLIVNYLTQFVYDTIQNYAQSSEFKLWAHIISDTILLRNQATSVTTYFWKKYGTNIFTEWANSQFMIANYPTWHTSITHKHVDISTSDPWEKVNTESPIFVHWKQSTSERVMPWFQTVLGIENPTLDMKVTEPLGKFADIMVVKSRNQSAKDIDSQWITEKSTTVHVLQNPIFDKIILDHTISPLLTQLSKTKADAVIWRESEYFKKYFQKNSPHQIVTPCNLSEFSDEMALSAHEASALTVWHQDISKYFIPMIVDITKELKVRIQTEFSKINNFPNTHIPQTQSNSLPINIDSQYAFDKATFRIQNKYLFRNSWIKEENIAGNAKLTSEIHWMQPATETVQLCIYTLYSTFNLLLHTELLVTTWSHIGPQNIKNPSENAKLSNILQFTQNEFLSVYPCIDDKMYKFIHWTQTKYVPEYKWTEVTYSKVAPWSNTDLFLENSWREGISSKLIYWSQFDTLTINPSFVIPWTQNNSPKEDTWIGSSPPKAYQEEYTLEHSDTVSLSSTFIHWMQPEYIPVVFWSQHLDRRYPPINNLMLTSYNYFILAHSESSNKITPMSSSETFTPMTLDEYQLHNHWVQSVSEKLIPWTKALSVSETLWMEGVFSTFLPWIKFIFPSEFTSIHTTYDAITLWSEVLTTREIPFSSTEFTPVQFYVDTSTDKGIFLTVTEVFEKILLTVSNINIFRNSIQSQPYFIQHSTQTSFPWGLTETIDSNTWSFSKVGSLLSWRVPDTLKDVHSAHHEYQISRNWYDPEVERIRPWTHTYFQTISIYMPLMADKVESWDQQNTGKQSKMTSATGMFSDWTISETKSLRLGNVPENTIVRPWIQVESITGHNWYQLVTNTVEILPLAKSQLITLWTQYVSDKISQAEIEADKYLYTFDNNAISSWYSIQSILRQRSKLEPETLSPLILQEWQIPLSWNKIEKEALKSMYNFEADTSQILLTYPKFDEINIWTQPESPLVRRWPEDAIVTRWPLNKNDKIIPQIQLEYESTSYLAQTNVGRINAWIQHIDTMETQEIIPWTHSDTLSSNFFQNPRVFTLWDPTQNYGIMQWPQMEYETTLSLEQPNIAVMNPLNLQKGFTETLGSFPWTHSGTVLSHPFQTQIDSTFWSLTQNYKTMQWTKEEYKSTLSLFQPHFDMINPLSQHKIFINTLEIFPSTHSDTVSSHLFHTETDSTLQALTQNIAIMHWPQMEYETTLALEQPNIGIINTWIHQKDSTETLETIPWTHSSNVLSHSFQSQIGSAFWSLTKRYGIMQWSKVEYESTLSLLHPNVGIIYSLSQHKSSLVTLDIIPWMNSDTLFLYSLQTQTNSMLWALTQNYGNMDRSQVQYEPTQSLVYSNVGISNPLIQHTDSTETLETIPRTYSHRLISYSLQTQIYSARLWKQPQSMVTAQIWSTTLEQVAKTQALTSVGTISPSFRVQEMLSSEEHPLKSSSHSETQEKHFPEPLSLRQSKLNVSLAECHLSMIWKDNIQALWLYKTAVVSHETTECGSRPGLVPHCPNCWEAEIGEFPWMVSVQLSYSHFCAGSILNEQWILTSARCANFIKRSESLALVQVGMVDLQDTTQGETVGIHRSMPYLGPRGPLGPGLIFLAEPLHFQPLVLPICLEESHEQERHIQMYDCWLPSWSLMRGSPGILQKRHLSIVQVSACAKFWPQLNEFTFCVEAKKAMGESGCKGDLGAPLVCRLKQKDIWVQVGILIHFDEHCTKPYVFSRVSPFVFWLQSVTQPSHAPWTHLSLVTPSPFISLSVSTKTKVSTFTSRSAGLQPHFISLPHPEAFADHISLQYTMPWQAMIFSCGNQMCSGSIISSHWVLTAAHCVRNMNPEDAFVVLGLGHPGTPLRVVKVIGILLHERFRLVGQAARHDLALVLLQETQSSVHIVAPLGNMKNLNTSECWLSGPQILKQGDVVENPEMLQIQVMGASNCAYLYPDMGSSTLCYIAQARGPEINMESVSPGSAVMCRPLSGNGKWRQIAFTSLKHLATIVSPHFSWILSTTAKAGYPLNQALIPWVENPKSSSLVKHPTTLLLSTVVAITIRRILIS